MSETGNLPNPPEEDMKLSSLLRNYVSLIGLAMAIVAMANIIFLFLIDLISTQPSPYIGIFAYMIMPGFLVFGLVLIPLGMWWERSRRRRQLPGLPKFPKIDLNNPSQRSSIAFVFSFVVLFVILSAVGSYRGYEYTDSTQFCGQLCHKVMNPEFVAHQNSAHARVRCVDCHVGAGASWYVRSKLSGARQVVKTVMNTYPHPIETPVANLRPAPETCEQCHWPKKFWGAQLKVINHFGTDEKNTPRQIRLLIKTGGGDPAAGQSGGIHWHMNINNIMTYRSDAKRQSIPYVRMQNKQTGQITEFYAQGFDQSKLPSMAEKRMDCVDCHNRPTHVYMPPDRSVDQSLLAKRIDPSLPFAKAQALEALTANYKSTDEALKTIGTKIPAFYREKYPEIASAHGDQVQQMVRETQAIFKRSIFPEMQVDWRTHPDNVGHFYFNGCFRCHDGNHVSKDGKVISKDCNSCHTVLGQEESGVPIEAVANVNFKHPVDLGDMTAVNCSDCHGAQAAQ